MELTEQMNNAILTGGEEINVVTFEGQTERVKVRLLPVKEFPLLLATMDDEIKRVCLLVGKPGEWAESLLPASHEAIIELGDKLNADFFARWIERRSQKASIGLKSIRGLSPELLETIVNKLVGASS